MDPVDEAREVQRAQEAKRLQSSDDAKRRENGLRFQQTITQQQAQKRDANNKQQKGAQQKAQASQAILARQGIQSRHLAESLHKHTATQNDNARVEVQGRRQEVNDGELRVQEKQGKVDKEQQDVSDRRLTPISGDEQRGRGGDGFSNDSGDSGGGASQQGNHGQAQNGIASLAAASEVKGANGPQAPHLPSELLQQLVNRVFAGVTPEGLSQFTIEFKGSVLGGARLDVVAQNGKIRCTFHTDDKHVGNLLKASEGQLARAFAQKGLVLERLAVEQR